MVNSELLVIISPLLFQYPVGYLINKDHNEPTIPNNNEDNW